jgi:hypothetical protein
MPTANGAEEGFLEGSRRREEPEPDISKCRGNRTFLLVAGTAASGSGQVWATQRCHGAKRTAHKQGRAGVLAMHLGRLVAPCRMRR